MKCAPGARQSASASADAPRNHGQRWQRTGRPIREGRDKLRIDHIRTGKKQEANGSVPRESPEGIKAGRTKRRGEARQREADNQEAAGARELHGTSQGDAARPLTTPSEPSHRHRHPRCTSNPCLRGPSGIGRAPAADVHAPSTFVSTAPTGYVRAEPTWNLQRQRLPGGSQRGRTPEKG